VLVTKMYDISESDCFLAYVWKEILTALCAP
jgi:hypothetical protein